MKDWRGWIQSEYGVCEQSLAHVMQDAGIYLKHACGLLSWRQSADLAGLGKYLNRLRSLASISTTLEDSDNDSN
jgi:hypothetical protein